MYLWDTALILETLINVFQSVPGSHGDHFLQFRYFSSLLLGHNAADSFQDCLAHADYYGNFRCRVPLSRRKYFRRSGKNSSARPSSNLCFSKTDLHPNFAFRLLFLRLKHLCWSDLFLPTSLNPSSTRSWQEAWPLWQEESWRPTLELVSRPRIWWLPRWCRLRRLWLFPNSCTRKRKYRKLRHKTLYILTDREYFVAKLFKSSPQWRRKFESIRVEFRSPTIVPLARLFKEYWSFNPLDKRLSSWLNNVLFGVHFIHSAVIYSYTDGVNRPLNNRCLLFIGQEFYSLVPLSI